MNRLTRRPQARPRLVPLEDRVAPATFTVTNTNDSGAGSLRTCVSQANAAAGADAIAFSTSTAGGAVNFSDGTPRTITLLSALPVVTGPTMITGPGSGLLTVARSATAGAFRVLEFGGAGSLSEAVTGLTVSGGSESGGAGILVNNDPLTLTDVAIRNNTATGADDGAGIKAQGSQPLTMTNCVVANNSCVAIGGGIGLVISFATVTIVNSTISGNTASQGGGVSSVYSAHLNLTNDTVANNFALYGGGLGLANFGQLQITGCTISGNRAGVGNPYEGGGLLINSGNLYNATISNSSFVGNAAHRGGGIHVQEPTIGSAGTLQVRSTTITGNSATYGGGGLYTNYAGVAFDNSIVSGNYGGDVYAGYHPATTAYSAIGTPTGFPPGPGDLPIGANLHLSPLADWGGPTQTVKLLPGSPAADAGDPALGGAGQTDQRGVARPQGAGVDIGAFEALPGPDPAITATDVTSAGGTAYQFTVTYTDTVPITTTTLGAGNVAVTPPAGLPAVAVSYVGADASNPDSVVATYQFTPPGGTWAAADNGRYAVAVEPNQVSDANGAAPAGPVGSFRVLVPVPVPFTVTTTADSGPGSLRDALTQANGLTGLGAVAVIGFSNSTTGGATNFYDDTPRTITLLSALPQITGTVAVTGPGSALLTVARSATAAAFRVFDLAGPGTVTESFSGLTISGGRAANGAGILDRTEPLTLADVALRTNTATGGRGGGMEILAAQPVTLTNSVVANNSATSGGGVALSQPGALTVANSTVSGNTGANGGGLYVNAPVGAAALNLTNSAVANNRAGTKGGGVAAYYGTTARLTADTISGNSAAAGGGGMNLRKASLTGTTISDCTITGNTGQYGGGLYVVQSGGTLGVQNSTITGNSATSAMTSYFFAGGITIGGNFYGAITLALDSTIVSGNHAINGHLDIAAFGSTTAVTTAYSAIGSTSGFPYTPGPGDLPVGAALNLQPLANNGGPTKTIAFAAGSPLLNAGDPNTSLTTDQRGQPRAVGGTADIGAYEYLPVTVAGVQVNDGSAQRSEVRSIAVTFSGPVNFAGGLPGLAFQLQHVQTGDNVSSAVAVSTNGAGQTVVTLTFLPTTINGVNDTDPISAANGGQLSLADGRYQLTVNGAAVSDAALGWTLDGDADGVPGGNYVSPAETSYSPTALHLYRLFGDATGDGVVDLSDLTAFRGTYNAGTGNPAYLSYLDADNSGVVDLTDLTEFRNRYNHSVY
jgi:hypothetical protein